MDKLLELLKFVERFLPAILVAWADRNRRAAAVAKAEAVVAKAEASAAKAELQIVEEVAREPDRRRRLDMLLRRAAARARRDGDRPDPDLPAK